MMDFKLVVISCLLVLLLVTQETEADFFYNRMPPLPEELDQLKLKCIPGRTVIKIEEQKMLPDDLEPDSGEDYDDYRRTHMLSTKGDQGCQICVCSAKGKDEYCSKRPAATVNECIVISQAMEKFNRNELFDHTRSLSYRIRRDYIWHNDEIPYEAKARCARGHSYYSNSPKANDTDIDIASDIESLLDYTDKDICYYCVCSTHGNAVGCITRNPWFCEYYRQLRLPEYARHDYANLFEHDRPTYFRQISHRMRRTMDNGLMNLLLTAGAGLDHKKCEPFISEYTDCTNENMCSGCTQCTCSAEGLWECKRVRVCEGEEQEKDGVLNDEMLQYAMETMQQGLTKKKKITKPRPHDLVPRPGQKLTKPRKKPLLGIFENPFEGLFSDRERRSVNNDREDKKNNGTVKFYGVVDELNEDTLKHSNSSGVIPADKVEFKKLPMQSRRTDSVVDSKNVSLHIEYNQPNILNHITDNQIDTIAHGDNKLPVPQSDTPNIFSNYTQRSKHNELSKIVVNELKRGGEVIGDVKGPVISNITFTPANSTVATVAFIAGHLMSSLWNMEKDASGTSMQAEELKHEKIADLIDLFKEPIPLSHERFIKNALEQLSKAIDDHLDLKNVSSICNSIEQARKFLFTNATVTINKSDTENKFSNAWNSTGRVDENKKLNTSMDETINKINTVMGLIRKLDELEKSIYELKNKSKEHHGTQTEKTLDKNSLNKFGVLLDQLTGLFLANNNKKGNKIKSEVIISENARNRIKKMFNVDLNTLNITTKDKIVYEYLTHIEENPNCVLRNKNKHKPNMRNLPDIESNILLNLSEFFKMKSFADLVNLLNPKIQPSVTTREPIQTTTVSIKRGSDLNSNKLEDTKEKLKTHLKSILEDLIEIQSARGINKSDINVSDALPCIYNILNSQKEAGPKNTHIDTEKNIANIFNELRNELRIAQYRRSGGDMTQPAPKSAIVWERVIKNINKNATDLSTRRSMDMRVPKSYEEIKKMIDKVESVSSNTYKGYAIQEEVPAAEKPVLLKALTVEVDNFIKILENIELSLGTFNNLPDNQKLDLIDFVKNAMANLNLNTNVIHDLHKPKTRRHLERSMVVSDGNIVIPNNRNKKKNTYGEIGKNTGDIRISKDTIINQLMKNRIVLYMRLKEAKGIDRNDINYKIGQHILTSLENGNYEMARQLYKVFLKDQTVSDDKRHGHYVPSNEKQSVTTMSILRKQPLIQFEELNTDVDRMKYLIEQQKAVDQVKWLSQQPKINVNDLSWLKNEPREEVNDMRWLNQQNKLPVGEVKWTNQQPLVDNSRWLNPQSNTPGDELKWSNQDELIKQLLNVKSMTM